MAKAIRDVYPVRAVWGYCDYEPMLGLFGEIVLKRDDDDYQGDSRVLYRDGERYGVLIFGWGSCSGCDALSACKTIEEVEKLADELRASIKWFESASAAVEYFKTHDWKGDWSAHSTETKKFVRDAIALLGGG